MAHARERRRESPEAAVSTLRRTDFRDLGLPVRLRQEVWINSGRTAAEAEFRPTITSKTLGDTFTRATGVDPGACQLSTRIFELDLQEQDQVVVQAEGTGLPLVVRRNQDLIVNFDVSATRACQVEDSSRPIYTYIPGFNIHKVPAGIRRRVSNLIKAMQAPRRQDPVGEYGKLPLTSFEFVLLLIDSLLPDDGGRETRLFHWPAGKRAVFVSLHDVDTGGFLRRRDRDPLFRVEQKHQIRSTWFVPTRLLRGDVRDVDFLRDSGHEVGWHGHNHDHRLPFKPFADRRVEILKHHYLARPENYPCGMRTPRLLKSNYLYDLLDRNCPALCYDTSILRGIAPYNLWLNGRPSNILEIPTTVPTDILLYNQFHGIPRHRRIAAMLEAQILRTKKLIDIGALVSIVTHPEKDLSERPDFLDLYDQYLSYVRGRSDVWFTTAGELFKYWKGHGSGSDGRRDN
jgi:peptidoglycan/xylan/chitin deacetylase (PgdA/CDA1 family)